MMEASRAVVVIASADAAAAAAIQLRPFIAHDHLLSRCFDTIDRMANPIFISTTPFLQTKNSSGLAAIGSYRMKNGPSDEDGVKD